MTVSILLALASMLSGATIDLIYRVAQRQGIDSGTFIFWQSVMFIGAIWLVGITSGQTSDITPLAWRLGPPSGFLTYLSLVLFINSLKGGDSSINTPIFRLSFVVTSIGAILVLGESGGLAKALGITLAVLSIASLANLTGLTKGTTNWPSLVQAVLAMALAGVTGVIVKEIVNQGSDTIPLILGQTPGFLTGSAGYMILTRKFRPNKVTIRLGPPIAALQLTWTFLLFQSLQTGDASISFPIVQLSFVLTAILAMGILNEKATMSKFIGLGLAAGSVGMFALA